MTDLLELGALTREEQEAYAAARRAERAARAARAQERAPNQPSAHALVAHAVVQLHTAMSTLKDANHAADPVTHLILLDCMRDLGAVENRVKALEHAMAMQGKRT